MVGVVCCDASSANAMCDSSSVFCIPAWPRKPGKTDYAANRACLSLHVMHSIKNRSKSLGPAISCAGPAPFRWMATRSISDRNAGACLQGPGWGRLLHQTCRHIPGSATRACGRCRPWNAVRRENEGDIASAVMSAGTWAQANTTSRHARTARELQRRRTALYSARMLHLRVRQRFSHAWPNLTDGGVCECGRRTSWNSTQARLRGFPGSRLPTAPCRRERVLHAELGEGRAARRPACAAWWAHESQTQLAGRRHFFESCLLMAELETEQMQCFAASPTPAE